MLDITLKRNSKSSLYIQIRDTIMQAIEEKKLNPGDRLPAVADLARQLGVTQATITRAFEDLNDSGCITSHVGRGTFVARKKAPRRTFATNSISDPEFIMAARRLRMGIAQSLEALQILTKRPGLIHFTSGVPDPKIVPTKVLPQLVQKALANNPIQYHSYSPAAGLPELRKEIAKNLSSSNYKILPEQVMVTNGSQQAISILAQSALENRQRILCETPCYMGIARGFGGVGHWVETVTRDAQGPLIERLDSLRGAPAMFYLCPQMHNPMGTDLSRQRYKYLINWAQEEQMLLIVDEIFRDLRVQGEAPNFLRNLGSDNVVIIGSVSKSFMCGLRIGWLVSSPQRVQSLTALKKAMDIGCAPLMQGIALELFKSGMYTKYIKKARQHYHLRRDAALEALKKHMPKEVKWSHPMGGFHMWLELPPGYSSIALFLLALERGVVIRPGPYFDVDHRFNNAFALSYGSIEPEKIAEGIELLADATTSLLQQPAGDACLSGLGDFL